MRANGDGVPIGAVSQNARRARATPRSATKPATGPHGERQPNLVVAPVGELEAGVGPGSVDIIATMPPTSRASVEGGVYGDLGRFAAHVHQPATGTASRATDSVPASMRPASRRSLMSPRM